VVSGTEEERRRAARAEQVALFRYQLIREAADPALTTRQRGRLVRDLAAAEHPGPFGQSVRVSRPTIDRWIRAWRSGGFAALAPPPRQVTPRTDAQVLELAAGLKRERPARTAAQIARVLRAQCGWSPPPRTLLRHFERLELTTRPDGRPPVVFGRFEAAAPNERWTGDALHGPRAAGRKAYLFAFPDDHSRAVMAGRWGYFEDTIRLAAALRPALAARGVPHSIYVVVLDIPGPPAICPAACGNDTPRRSLTFQVLTRIVRRHLAIEGDAEVCGGQQGSSCGRVGRAAVTGCAA
jgi:putative transposase